ncbi:hypothetical protein WBG78_19075 [Chryseolinea sp. T2]|uniref:hypothetical protein n=1 Tax=Chryseolinea sp. T2 TaxID=3129255 RepID=UPI003076C6B2
MYSTRRLLQLAVALILISSSALSGTLEKKKKAKVYYAWITLTTHRNKIKGIFREVGDSSVVVYTNEQSMRIPAVSIKKLVFRRKASAGRGALIGAVTGLVVGGVAAYAGGGESCDGCYSAADNAGWGAFFGSGFGALVGTIIGTIPKKQVNINGDQRAFESNHELLRKYSLSDTD